MTQARLELRPETGAATLTLQIDLLRTLGSTQAYKEFAQDLNNPAHEPQWRRLADAIEIYQAQTRLPLTVRNARHQIRLIPQRLAIRSDGRVFG